MFNEHSNIVINIHGHEFEISGRKAVGAFVIAVLVTVFLPWAAYWSSNSKSLSREPSMFNPQEQAERLAKGILNRPRGQKGWDDAVGDIAEALQAARVFGRNEAYELQGRD